MIKNIGQLVEGMKVVLAIYGTVIRDARVMLGTGTDGKPRVWFCQNAAEGSRNANPYGYRYAYSVGVNGDGTLRLDVNSVTGLRAWTEADAEPQVTLVLADGSRVADVNYVNGALLPVVPAGYRLERLAVAAVEKTVTVNGEKYPVKFSDGAASAGMEFKTVSKFAAAAADRRQAADKYDALRAEYNRLAAAYGWTRA